jgi:serine/threonine protein kinase
MREFSDGQLVPGTRYRVLSLLGEGGMGSVYEVEHVELGKRFVLKALFRELAGRKDLVGRLRNEWRALGRLDHPNIINVTDAGVSDSGVHFYVMERAEGETLADRLRRTHHLPPRQALEIARAVLEGLAAAHDIGIVHRDIKPPNIYLLQGGAVKLLDFGIAKLLDANVEVITARGMAIGTPRYMSPEQARGESVDGRADLYAVGLLLYEMLTGVGPFDDAPDAPEMLLAHLTRIPARVSTVVPDVGASIDDLVQSLLRKIPAERPSSARQVAGILAGMSLRWQAVCTDAPTPAANYHAVTSENASPRAPAVADGTARIARASQPPGSTAIDGLAGKKRLAHASTQALPPQTTPVGSTLIIRPSGEVTATVDTVRDERAGDQHLADSSAGATSATSATPPPGSGSEDWQTDATLAAEHPDAQPWSAPMSVDRTLAEAGSPHEPPAASEREHTQEIGELSAPSPPRNSDLPTRTAVPVGTLISTGGGGAETPPPVEMSQSIAPSIPPARKSSALVLIAAAAVALLGLVVVAGFALLRSGSDVAASAGTGTVAAPAEPAAAERAAPEPAAPEPAAPTGAEPSAPASAAAATDPAPSSKLTAVEAPPAPNTPEKQDPSAPAVTTPTSKPVKVQAKTPRAEASPSPAVKTPPKPVLPSSGL